MGKDENTNDTERIELNTDDSEKKEKSDETAFQGNCQLTPK